MIETLLIVAALAMLAMPVVAVVAIVIAQRAIREIADLRARLAHLEQRTRTGYQGAGPEAEEGAPQATPQVTPQVDPGVAPESKAPPAQPAETGRADEKSGQAAPPPPPPPAPAPVPAIAAPRPAKASLEERLGARWAVWVGALALGLGGAFLVRFSLEQDLLGPGARIGLAALLALALLIGGEFLRRRDFALSLPGIGPGHVPAALTAAGAASAFATAYAAFALYGFLGPGPAFLLLGALGLLTMLAAALHGPLLAALGLLGAFAVPLLTGGESGQTWPLVPYFLVVTVAAHALAWLRGWRWVAVAATGLALFWTIPMLDGPDLPARLHLLIQTALAVFIFAFLPYRMTPVPMQQPDNAGRAVLIGILVVLVLAMNVLFDGAGTLYFPALMIALLLAAGAVPALSGAGVAALIAVVVTLLLWPVAREAIAEPTRILPGPAGDLPWPESFRRFIAFALVGGFATSGLGLWRLREAGQMVRRITADYAFIFAAAPALILVVVYWRLTGAARLLEGLSEPAFAIAAAVLAGAYAMLATRARALSPGAGDAAASAMVLICGLSAIAALSNLALALAFWLDRGMLTVAFALAGAGAAFVAQRSGIHMLRYGVGALAIVVSLRLLWDPGIVDGDPGRTIVFNWLLWGYGVPAIAFLFAANRLGRDGRDAMARLSEALGIIFAVLLVFFQLRHALHGGVPPARIDGLLDAGLAVLTVLCAALVLLRVDNGRPDPVTRIGARVFGLIALVVSGAGLLVTVNPLITNAPVPGGPFLNALLPAYLFPAIVAAVIAVMIRRALLELRAVPEDSPQRGRSSRLEGERLLHWQAKVMAALAFLLQAAWSVMAIRMAFQGPLIGLTRQTGEAELWAYSAVLLIVGLAALVIGLWRHLPWLRLIAASYLTVAAAKVFLVDLAGLGGPIRAASFIALGAVLVGVGLLYQRLLSRSRPRAGDASPSAAPAPQPPSD